MTREPAWRPANLAPGSPDTGRPVIRLDGLWLLRLPQHRRGQFQAGGVLA
jgi:hypothetical protein